MAIHGAFMPGALAQSHTRAWLTTVDHKRISILYRLATEYHRRPHAPML